MSSEEKDITSILNTFQTTGTLLPTDWSGLIDFLLSNTNTLKDKNAEISNQIICLIFKLFKKK